MALGLIHLDLSPWLTIPAGAVVGGLAGALIGFPTFRLRGHYFALAMLAYPLATLYVFQWLGYQEIPLPMKREAPILYMQFADQRAYVVLALGLLVITLLISLTVENSRFGMSLFAIKQNEPAAEAAGIDTWRWKMLALMLSGALAAMAGGLYAVVLLVVTPEAVFGMLVSAQALILALFGGVGSLWGPVIGAVVLVPLAEGLNAKTRRRPAGHPGRGLRHRDHRDHSARPRRRLLAHSRSRGSVAARAGPDADGQCDHPHCAASVAPAYGRPRPARVARY